jgi:hypothetical protein
MNLYNVMIKVSSVAFEAVSVLNKVLTVDAPELLMFLDAVRPVGRALSKCL